MVDFSAENAIHIREIQAVEKLAKFRIVKKQHDGMKGSTF
jgi:hypothetical protein